MDVDAEHRPLVRRFAISSLTSAIPTCRLVIKADAPFPSGASEHDWRHSRSREAGDVNAEVREAVGRNGYRFFKIGLSLSEIPRP
jgi:hypothetical protein